MSNFTKEYIKLLTSATSVLVFVVHALILEKGINGIIMELGLSVGGLKPW